VANPATTSVTPVRTYADLACQRGAAVESKHRHDLLYLCTE
jgi:hypothetical protein